MITILLIPIHRPKTAVVFEGALHQPIFKELKIQNPSNKPISYSLSLVGEDRSSFSVQPSSLAVSASNYYYISVNTAFTLLKYH